MAGYIGAKQGVTQVDGYNRSEADAEFVNVTGDTMTGNLTVGGTGSFSVSSAVSGVFNRNTSSGATLQVQVVGNNVGTLGSSTDGQGRFDIASQAALLLRAGAEFARFDVAGSERARIDSSGNLLVGTTDNQMHVATSGGGVNLLPSGRVYAASTEAGSGSPGNFNRISTDGAAVALRRNGAVVGTISVTTTATAYNTSSDYRLKENVVPLAGAADRLAQIPVHRFNFIADPDTTVDGFLAHEVQAIIPEAVTGEKDAVDADGKPVHQGIDQSKLVPLLTAALQEALTEIQDLKARVATLEGGAA